MSIAYARVTAGQAQLLLITGAAGIGKTRLVEELAGQAEEAQILTGESAPLAGAALAYGPFVDALGTHAEWLLADDGRAGDQQELGLARCNARIGDGQGCLLRGPAYDRRRSSHA